MNAMLTSEQASAIASAKGEQIRLTDPITKEDYVLVKADVFQRFQQMLGDDEAVYTTAEMMDRIMADDDANDPQLAELQKKYGGVQG